MMGTIKKVTTFASKGGGLSILFETAERDKANDLVMAEGNVLKLTAQVSKHKAVEEDDDRQVLLNIGDIPNGDD